MNTTVVSGYTLTTKGKYSSTISWTVDQDHSEILFNNQLIKFVNDTYNKFCKGQKVDETALNIMFEYYKEKIMAG